MKVTKAVIPAAGFGTRFLPATKAVPKEMLPIVDKPTIQYIVEEAIASGIEDLLIITSRGKDALVNHFDKAYELETILERDGKQEMLNAVREVSDKINVQFVRQKEQKGLGHAVLCAKSFVGNEPFAVMLGDDVVVAEKPCLSQLIEQFDKYKKISENRREPGMAEKTQTRRGPLGWVKRHKKLTIFLAILLVAALVLVNVLGKTDKAAADSYQFVRTTVLTKTTLSDTVSVTGTVKAGSSASVTASDSVKTYKVTAVNVAVGDTVRKGDVIATLDTTDVEKQIANAQLQLSDTRTDARKNYTQAVEDQTTNLATAQENLDKAQKNYDTLGMDDYYTSMASAANSGKTNREIVTDWYTRYAEEIAGYENTLANLNIQLTQAQQDGDTARADGLQGQITDYTNRENIAKGQCSIPELGLQGFDAVSQAYNKIEQYREALEQAQQSYQNSATSASRSVDNAETKLAQSQREDDTLTNLQTALENCTLTATMDGTITALDATVGAVCSGTVATIQDVDNLTVEVTIPASSVGRLKTGLQCNITSDATDDTVTGTLTRIDPVANDNGSFGATVTVNGQDSGLLVGIPAKVEIVISTKDNVFTVPRDAVGTNDDGSTYVLRKTGGEGVDMTFEQVAVTEGDTNDYYVEITGSDLNEGDVIRATADLTQGIESGTSDSDVQMMENGDLYVGDGSNMPEGTVVMGGPGGGPGGPGGQ